MLNKILFYFVISLWFKKCIFLNFKIETTVLFCSKSTEIDLDLSCLHENELLKRMVCIIELNTIKLSMDQYNDEFRNIYTLNAKKILYFLDSKVYNTKCVPVNSLEIEETAETCTKDLLVNFQYDGKIVRGYLTKEEILRNSSFSTECPVRESFLSIDNNKYEIIRNKNKIEINIKTTNVSEFQVETELINLNGTFFANIFSTFQNIEFNGLFQITKDSLYFIILILIFCLLFFLTIKYKKSNMISLIKSIINYYLPHLNKSKIDEIEIAKNSHNFSSFEKNDSIECINLDYVSPVSQNIYKHRTPSLNPIQYPDNSITILRERTTPAKQKRRSVTFLSENNNETTKARRHSVNSAKTSEQIKCPLCSFVAVNLRGLNIHCRVHKKNTN